MRTIGHRARGHRRLATVALSLTSLLSLSSLLTFAGASPADAATSAVPQQLLSGNQAKPSKTPSPTPSGSPGAGHSGGASPAASSPAPTPVKTKATASPTPTRTRSAAPAPKPAATPAPVTAPVTAPRPVTESAPAREPTSASVQGPVLLGELPLGAAIFDAPSGPLNAPAASSPVDQALPAALQPSAGTGPRTGDAGASLGLLLLAVALIGSGLAIAWTLLAQWTGRSAWPFLGARSRSLPPLPVLPADGT